MNIKLVVYGGISAGGGGCSCGCTSCTPADAKAEYEAMKKELNKYYSLRYPAEPLLVNMQGLILPNSRDKIKNVTSGSTRIDHLYL